MLSKNYIFIFVSYAVIAYSSGCDPPWMKYKDHCYYFYNVTSTLRPKSWDDSRMICQQLGGDLLSIADMDEQKFISGVFSSDKTIKNKNFWIGLNDKKNESVYEWSDGTPYNGTIFNYWRSSGGEPNDYMGMEDCAETTWDGRWNDNNCQTEFGFICKRKEGATTVVPTLPPYPNTTDKPTTCEAGWIPWGSSCYGIIKGRPKNWQDARSDCLRRFGDLLVIDSQDENDFITREITPLRSEYWIGLTDQGLSKQFHWVDGTPLNASLNKNWRPGEPSNSFFSEDCVEIYGHWLPGKWNDNHCTSVRDYICEKKGGVHNCPDGWFTYKDYCYQINAHPNQKSSWADGRRVCLDYNKPWEKTLDVANADLVSIHSADEQSFLEQQFRKFGVKGINDYFWTGLHNIGSAFSWTDHSTYDYQHWKGQPTDAKNNCTKSSIASYGHGWEGTMCDEKNYFVCKVRRGQDRCYDPIGIQDFQIPDSSFTASSQLSVTTPPFAARLYLKADNTFDGAWCAAKNDKAPWLQINLGKPERLTYLALQGKSNSDALATGLYLKYSMDGVTWDVYGDNPPTGYIKFRIPLAYRTNHEKAFSLNLPKPLVAQYIRLYPVKDECNVDCCLRFELYGCSVDVNDKYCGVGWERDPKTKHCYQLNSQQTTFDAADNLCLSQGSKLVSVTSMEEQKFINNFIKPLSGRVTDFWMGLNDQDEEGVFLFNDNSPLLLNNWYPSFPSKDTSKNCVAMRGTDGKWQIKDCTEFRSFMCKKSYNDPFVPKKSFNNNWASAADLYWPLDSKSVKGTMDGSLLLKAFGTFNLVSFNGRVDQKYISFDGSTSYLNTPSIANTCASHPDSGSCPHGLTVSFIFKYDGSVSASPRFILDTMGDETDAVGFRVFVQNKRIVTLIRGSLKTFRMENDITVGQWNQYAFSWSSLNGLKTYFNGKETATTSNHGSANIRKLTKESVKTLFIGKSASSGVFTKMSFGSLAVFERVLSSSEIESIYVTVIGTCDSGQIPHGSYCYEFNSNGVSWDNAKSDCDSKGGSLASIHSSVEQAFVSLKSGPGFLNNEMWIGMSMKKGTPFNWIDSSDVRYTYWKSGEPNSGVRQYFYKRCVNTQTGTGRWSDMYCYSKKAYVCKYKKNVNTKKDNGLRNFVGSYYVTKTIGCPLSQHMDIVEVTYGSKSSKCFLDKTYALNIVKSKCSGLSCQIKASDSFFGKNPCTSYAWKTVNVTYACVDDKVDKVDQCAGYMVSTNGTKCYKLFTNKMSYADAENQCKTENGTLATINTEKEQLLLTSMLSKLTSQSDVWIGLKYDDKTQTYQWSNNATVIYTKWINKQPNPTLGVNVKVGVDAGLKPMMWKPAEPHEMLPFFCEKSTGKKVPTAAPTTPGPKKSCYASWKEYNGYCYYYNTQASSFVDADKNCSKLATNAHTASIMSSGENTFLWNLVYNKTGGNDIFTWLGLDNEGIINGFRWRDGNPLSYINWYPTRPYTGARHFCGAMDNNGQWYDLPCFEKYPSICKVPKGDLVVTTLPPSTPTPDPTLNCPKSWLPYNSSCYYVSSYYAKKDYHEAAAECLSMNSTLVSILNEQENNFVYSLRRKNLNSKFFIGLRDVSMNSGWSWADNSPVTYFNWATINLPDNYLGYESCVEMVGGNGKWNDIPCNVKGAFACKLQKDKPLPTAPVIPKDKGYCDAGWELYGNNCYNFQFGVGHEKNYNDAKDFCRSFDKSDLASVHNRYENAFLFGHSNNDIVTFYIGLSDIVFEKTFLWADQTSVDYTNWGTSEPSSHGDEDCVEVKSYYQNRGKWNDINCAKKNHFVCKKPSSPNKPTSKPTPTPDKNPCPENFRKLGKSCYHLAKESKTWKEAVTACKSMKSELYSIQNIYEQAYLFSQFIEYANATWVGLSRDKGATQFKYVDGAPLLYTFWKKTPSAMTNLTQCVSQHKTNDGEWKVTECTTKLPYVCKINREPLDVAAFQGNCSEGWGKFNGKCYSLFSKKLNWPQARKACISYGGDLATIDSYSIQKYLEYLTRKESITAWIGLNDRENEHRFSWSSGVSFVQGESYSNWNTGEPNDSVGKENCIEMWSNHGKWNDLPCSYQHAYICEHSPECKDPAGFESGALADVNFVATSNYTGAYAGHFARLNGKSAWCTNITDGTQSLTVNLQKYLHITRISSQGGKHDLYKQSWTVTYQLEYSDDGNTWKTYVSRTDGGSSNVLPSNNDGSSVQSNKVDIKANYLRFTPKKYKGNLMCLRLEVYGCVSVCMNPLTSISSSFKTSDNEHGGLVPSLLSSPRCLKNYEGVVFYKLAFKNPVKVSRFTVLVKSEESVKYKVMYQMEGKNYTLETDFSSAVSTYRLDKPFVGSIIYVIFPSPKNSICLNAEFYGCLFECDSELGIRSKKLPDYLMVAKSEKPGFPASAARLDSGYYNKNSWCAANNDLNQYLQIDLTKEAHITGIATQGFYGDKISYVNKYILQWSNDGDLWRQHSSGEISGNEYGEMTVKNKLSPPIQARYLRIVPTQYTNNICMRIELYGCSFEIPNVVPPDQGNTSTDSSDSGLSDGGKIGLILFFVILIIIIIVISAIYYFRHIRRGFTLHKSFSNPVHVDINNDEIDIINYAE